MQKQYILGVTLRNPSLKGELAKQNYGSGFTFPLFLSRKKRHKKELHCNPSRELV